MKYCTHCGAQIDDNALYCDKCGANQQVVTPEVVVPNPANRKEEKSVFYLISFILCIITCVSIGWTIIPLAWCIPLTVKVYRAYQNNESISTAASICILIFVNVIAGILLLVGDSDK